MYSIGEVASQFHLPVSTLRYYDKEGLFPNMKRVSGMRRFSATEIETLRVIECLKKSGLSIKDIRRFIDLCSEGSRSYAARKALFEAQRVSVEREMAALQATLDMLTFKCWYYEEAMARGGEDSLQPPDPAAMPADVRRAYVHTHSDLPTHK